MADLPNLIAQLRAAALGRWPRVMPQAVSVPCGDLLRILDAYAEMERALQTLVKYADWQMREGADYHPTLPSAVSAARAALQQKDKADE